ncbi:MAG: pyruvate dehydrogenase complex dihydrolipoamide acetyltransferase [Pseudomonadota bacterium]
MPTNILMPALSPTMEKGNLAKWLKKEGDTVKSGDVLAEIETDKATMEVEAVDEGTLGKILINAGTNDVAVNTPIAVLLNDGEKASDIGTAAAPAPKVAAQKENNVIPLSQNKPAAAPAQLVASSSSERVFASPLAKRIAKQKGVDLSRVKGSGPHGRIIEKDILNAPAGGAASASMAQGMSDTAVRQLYEPGSYEEIPHDQMRRIIAQRLTESKQTIPHFYLTVDCDLEALLAARTAMNHIAPMGEDGKSAYKLSVNDFVIKAMASALQRVPNANVTWTSNALLKHKHSDIGVAVAIEGGLMTPIIRKAETLSLPDISAQMKDYAKRAKTRRLAPHEYQGGSTAISNLGMMGIKNFSAVINPPHATILAVGAGEQRVVVQNGQPVVRTMMSVTLATDHRAVDGVLGAELLNAFKMNIEQPALMFV